MGVEPRYGRIDAFTQRAGNRFVKSIPRVCRGGIECLKSLMSVPTVGIAVISVTPVPTVVKDSMTYVEVRTGEDADSHRPTCESRSIPSRSHRSAVGEWRKCREKEQKRPRQSVMSLTSCELGEELQTLPVVDLEDLLDEVPESDSTTVLRSVVREVLANGVPNPTVAEATGVVA